MKLILMRMFENGNSCHALEAVKRVCHGGLRGKLGGWVLSYNYPKNRES